MMGGTHPDRPRPGVLCTAALLLHDAALVTMHRLSATPWSQPGKPQEPLISQTAVLAPSPPLLTLLPPPQPSYLSQDSPLPSTWKRGMSSSPCLALLTPGLC